MFNKVPVLVQLKIIHKLLAAFDSDWSGKERNIQSGAKEKTLNLGELFSLNTGLDWNGPYELDNTGDP